MSRDAGKGGKVGEVTKISESTIRAMDVFMRYLRKEGVIMGADAQARLGMTRSAFATFITTVSLVYPIYEFEEHNRLYYSLLREDFNELDSSW